MSIQSNNDLSISGLETTKQFNDIDLFIMHIARVSVDVLKSNPKYNLNKTGIYTIGRDDLIINAFKIMSQNNILSLPVISEDTNRYYGIIDMSLVVTYISNHFGNYEFTTYANFQKFYSELKIFEKLTVNDVIKGPWYDRIYTNVVYDDQSLLSVFELLSNHHHRICVINFEKRISSLFTQSMALQYLKDKIEFVNESVKMMPASDIITKQGKPINIKEDEKTIEAFIKMTENNVSGLGIVDAYGVLVDVISIKDLRSVSLDENMVWRLYDNLKNFKRYVRETKALETPIDVITVELNDTLESCIHVLLKANTHRVFLVDEFGRPIKCISIGDILHNILNYDRDKFI